MELGAAVAAVVVGNDRVRRSPADTRPGSQRVLDCDALQSADPLMYRGTDDGDQEDSEVEESSSDGIGGGVVDKDSDDGDEVGYRIGVGVGPLMLRGVEEEYDTDYSGGDEYEYQRDCGGAGAETPMHRNKHEVEDEEVNNEVGEGVMMVFGEGAYGVGVGAKPRVH